MVSTPSPSSISVLKEVHLLRIFSEEELNQLQQLGTTATYEAHSNIVIEGELTWGLYIILDGMVGIFKTNKLSGDIYDVGQLRQGQFFGEMSLIDDNPRSATVRAISDCNLLYLPKDAFHQFLGMSSDVKLRFYQSCIRDLVARLRELDDNYVISQYQLWKVAIRREAA